MLNICHAGGARDEPGAHDARCVGGAHVEAEHSHRATQRGDGRSAPGSGSSRRKLSHRLRVGRGRRDARMHALHVPPKVNTRQVGATERATCKALAMLETGDVPLTETPQMCGISELLRGALFDCTTLDLQASRLVNSNHSGSTTQHLQRLSQLLGEGGEAASPRLRSLVLNGVHVGNQGAEYLFGALMHPTLLALRMDSCGISKQGAYAVASALNGGAAMRSLSLSWNALGPSGGIAIAVALRRNGSHLSRLYLSHCELGAEGAAALAETVRLGSPLTELVLSQNRAGDTGGLAFAEALSTGPPLQSLDLGCTGIVKVPPPPPPGGARKSDPAPPQGVPGGSGWRLGTPKSPIPPLFDRVGTITLRTEAPTRWRRLSHIMRRCTRYGSRATTWRTRLDPSLNPNLNPDPNPDPDPSPSPSPSPNPDPDPDPNQGARAFGTMLRTNRALRHLGLWNNGIGCGGADALERGLRENTVLSQLTLAHNDLEVNLTTTTTTTTSSSSFFFFTTTTSSSSSSSTTVCSPH